MLCSLYYKPLPLREAWWQVVVASDCQRLRGQVENSVPNITVVNVGESDSGSTGGKCPPAGQESMQ